MVIGDLQHHLKWSQVLRVQRQLSTLLMRIRQKHHLLPQGLFPIRRAHLRRQRARRCRGRCRVRALGCRRRCRRCARCSLARGQRRIRCVRRALQTRQAVLCVRHARQRQRIGRIPGRRVRRACSRDRRRICLVALLALRVTQKRVACRVLVALRGAHRQVGVVVRPRRARRRIADVRSLGRDCTLRTVERCQCRLQRVAGRFPSAEARRLPWCVPSALSLPFAPCVVVPSVNVVLASSVACVFVPPALALALA
jgi:hypothetical protein